SSRPLIGHAVDFDLAVDHHVALDAGAGGRVLAEIAFINSVEAPEIARIVEPHAAAHDMFETVAGLVENGDDVLYGQVGLLDDAGADDLAVLHGDLAGNIEPAARLDGAGEGQVLATSTGFIGTVTL